MEELLRVTHMMGLGGASQVVLGKRLLHAFGIGQLLVTEGGNGAWLLQSDGTYHHTVATPPLVDMVDSVGAGDGFAREICRLRGAIPDSDDFCQPFITAWHGSLQVGLPHETALYRVGEFAWPDSRP